MDKMLKSSMDHDDQSGTFAHAPRNSLQAHFLIPMAVNLAFGLLFASFVLLFLLPIIIGIVSDLRWLPSTIGRKR